MGEKVDDCLEMDDAIACSYISWSKNGVYGLGLSRRKRKRKYGAMSRTNSTQDESKPGRLG